MAFNFEDAVQQGFNRDFTTNDWNVQARNLEIALEDAGGVSEFRILDSGNVAVVVADSDGYLSIAGNAEVHGGHLLIRGESLTNTEFVTLQDQTNEASIFLLDGDPNGNLTGSKGSLGLNYTDGYVYTNRDGVMNWDRLALFSQIATVATTTVTLQNAYDNDADGGDATIVTNSVDGNVVISGTEALRVNATGGIDLDTQFDMDGAGPFTVDISGSFSVDVGDDSNITVTDSNLLLETVNTGDVIIRIPAVGGDFVVDEGAGIDYIRAEAASNELRLGSLGGSGVNVKVLSNMTVDGDLTVLGETTVVNTENLYIEDRMIRLNTGALAGFNSTAGMEIEVGSDGYVEFHWNDTAARWEISIDRNTTPEAQTFRPLPYLASSPATLDLSSIGTNGTPNTTSGAAVINTNDQNFTSTFGPYMVTDSVQSALEAIDGYLSTYVIPSIVAAAAPTLQNVYDNDVNGGDATITTNATDGDVVIAGTEQFRVTADGGVDVDTIGPISLDADAASNFTVDGNNLTLSTVTSGNVIVNAASNVDVDGTNITLDATSGISLDAAAASNFTTSSGALTLDGAGGVILDGNGSNVRPAADDTDTLGTASFGWSDVYIRNVQDNATVAIRAAGGATAPNTTSGASIVGTNSGNFFNFGPDMTADTVQAALEAIDGYLGYLASFTNTSTTTLHQAYKNDPDGADAIITTDSDDGNVVIAGTESLWVTATGGINLDTGFDMDATQAFDVNVTNAPFSLDAYNANSNVTVDSADLVVGTTTSGVLTLYGATGIVLDGTGDHVRPADDRVNTLGRSDAGWLDLYIANVPNTATVALRAAGGVTAPNTTSGAHAVGTNASNFATFGPDMTDNTVQAALEAIDGYLHDFTLDSVDTTFTQEIGLSINGAVLNGNVKVSMDGGAPSLDFVKAKTSRASWSIPVPKDWDGVSNIAVEVVWSPSDSTAGNVEWRLEYLGRSLTELVSGAVSTDDYAQAAGGTADALQTTADNLVIPAVDIATTDEVIVVNIVRRGTVDTYNGDAQIILVKYSYVAENIVE